jgi:hypothetical protein
VDKLEGLEEAAEGVLVVAFLTTQTSLQTLAVRQEEVAFLVDRVPMEFLETQQMEIKLEMIAE